MSANVKVGLMGCGKIAQWFHLKVLARMPGVELAALADADAKLLASAKGQAPGSRTYTDYRELLTNGGVDAVVNCLPTGLHAKSAIAAFEAGKHIYLEKPIAITMEEAEGVAAAWKRSGKAGMVGFNFRHHPLHRRAKAMLAGGAIGKVVAVRSIFCSAKHELPNWKKSRATGGGVLLDLFSHHADLARFFFDAEVESVFAHVRSVASEQDTASVELRLSTASGLVGMQSFHSLTTGDVDRFEFLGDAGTLVLDRYAGTVEALGPARPRGAGAAVGAAVRGLGAAWRVARPAGEPSYRAALEAFVRAAADDGSVSPDIGDGLKSLQIVAAAERSTGSAAAAVV